MKDFKSIFLNYIELIEKIKSQTKGLIGSGIDLSQYNISLQEQKEILKALKTQANLINTGEDDELVFFIDNFYHSHAQLIRELSKLNLDNKNVSPSLKKAILKLIVAIRNFDSNLKREEKSENSDPTESLTHPVIDKDPPEYIEKVYQVKTFAYNKHIDEKYFPTTPVKIDIGNLKNYSRQELVDMFDVSNFYKLSDYQIQQLSQAVVNDYCKEHNIPPCEVRFAQLDSEGNTFCAGEYRPNEGVILMNEKFLKIIQAEKGSNNQFLPYDMLSTLIHETTHRVQFSQFGEKNLSEKDSLVQKSLTEPQQNKSMSEYLAEFDELDARNSALQYFQNIIKNSPELDVGLAQYYNIKKYQEDCNRKAEIARIHQLEFPNIYNHFQYDIPNCSPKQMKAILHHHFNIIENISKQDSPEL